MFLAEEIATNVNWTLIFTGIMSLATLFMWWDARKARSTTIGPDPLRVQGMAPPNEVLSSNLKQMNIRVRALEDWRNDLVDKLNSDKQQILKAGEERASRIHQHIENDRKEIDRRLDALPNNIIATLKNTGAI